MSDRKDELFEDSELCVKCGACLAVCPVYKELCEESKSPRGRASLAEAVMRGEIELTDRLVEIFAMCLACGACEDVCKKKIPLTKIVYLMRELLYSEKHHDKITRAVTRLMYKSPRLFSLLLKNAARVKSLLFKSSEDGELIIPRLPLPLLGKTGALPDISSKFFLDNEFEDVSDKEHIALYTGCIYNLIFPDIAMKSLNMLKGIEDNVHVNTEHVCCGYPALTVGDAEKIKESVLKNVRILNKTDPKEIVALCSSCSMMLKKLYPGLLKDEPKEVIDEVARFSDKIINFTDYIFNHIDEISKRFKVKEKVRATYHLPCHLSKGLNASNAFLKIISGMENIELIEPENPDSCCGYGGFFNYKYNELAKMISDKKIADIMNTGADIVLTTCSGCILQLKEGLMRHGSKIKVKHISEILTANRAFDGL